MGEKLKELAKKPIFWIAIAGVALFAIIRSRASAGRPQAEMASQQPFQGGGGGGGGFNQEGTSTADQIGQQELEAIKQQLSQQGALFNFDLQQKQAQAGMLQPLQQAYIDVQTALQKGMLSQVQHTKAQCAHGDAKIDPETGQLYCRTPEGGGFKPFQQVGEIISGNLTGVKNVVAGIWQGAAAAAPGITQEYLGSVTGFPSFPTGGGQSQRPRKSSGGSNQSQQGMSDNPLAGMGGHFEIPQVPTFSGLP